MKALWIIIGLTCLTTSLFSQYSQRKRDYSSNAITVGVLQGGGSLIGADIEFLLSGRLGIQAGAGFVGFGGGINYHLGPSIRSSFISLQYWNQGIGDSFSQSVVGPNLVYRAKKWFTCQFGIGVPLEEGPAYPDNMEQPPVMLMYAIGAYFPIN